MDWHDSIPVVLLKRYRVLHSYENWIVHSPSISLHVPAVICSLGPYVHIKRQVSHCYSNAFLRDRFTCQYCGKAGGPMTGDHVVPKSHKGNSLLSNITTACSKCNNKKGNDKNVLPRNMPFVPSYYDLVRISRSLPINVPHASWIDYIGWGPGLVKVVEPVGMPGYLPLKE